MKKCYSSLIVLILVSINIFSNSNKNKQVYSDKENVPSSPKLQGDGVGFISNKGQFVDINGKLCPDVLYKGNVGRADIYLRKSGVSYVYSNVQEMMHEVDEQIEELQKAGSIAPVNIKQKRQELLQMRQVNIHRVDMNFEGCNESVGTTNENEINGYWNFYFPNCPKGITNIAQYNKVTYKNIYNNIDIAYYGNKAGLEYDLIVNPNGDPNQIKLNWKGVDALTIENGKLKIKTSLNEFYESIPKVYQNVNGKIVDVKAEYILNENIADRNNSIEQNNDISSSTPITSYLVSFNVGAYNKEFPLIIDPWATYYGGSATEFSSGIVTDKAGNVIVSGYTFSTNFPVSAGAFQMAFGGIQNDAFVVKFNSEGVRLWATYYGGSTDESSHSIACDNAGNIVIVGQTSSINFPVSSGAFQMAFGGGASDAFVVKLNSAGSRIWASYYGGSTDDKGIGVAIDNSDNVVFTGFTNSVNFPVLGGSQMVVGGAYDAFLVKLNTVGTIQWATFYGGNGADYARGIAIDNANNIIIVGNTQSSNFPISAGAIQVAFAGGSMMGDAFLVKFNSVGMRIWATYYGGTGDDLAQSVAIDLLDNLIITGSTSSTNFPTGKTGTNIVFQFMYGGGSFDAFVAKFNSTGIRQWATFYGGVNWDFGFSVITDVSNNIYLLAEEEDVPTPVPVDACSYQPVFNGGSTAGSPEDLRIVKFSAIGKKICSTFLGGTGEDDIDDGGGITINGNSLYLAGYTTGGYPVTSGAFQTTFGGGTTDAFITSICTNVCEGKSLGLNYTASSTTTCSNTLVSFTPVVSNSCDTSGYKYQWTFTGGTPASSTAVNPGIIYTTQGTYPVKLVLTTACKKDSLIKLSYITVNSCSCVISATGIVTSNETCSGVGDGSAQVNIGSGSGGPYTYSWSNGISGTTTATTLALTGLSANTYTVTVTEGSCSSISIVSLSATNTLNINSISATNIGCLGGSLGNVSVSISSSAGGPYTYNWSTGASSITNSLTNSINNISPGTYTVTITQGSCTTSSSVTFVQAHPLVVGATAEWSCLTNAGNVIGFSVNGTTPYSYLWSNGQTSETSSGLSLGTTYTLTVTDALGCTATSEATPAIIPITLTSTSKNNGCNSIGSAAVKVTSGILPYLYSWSNGTTGTTASPLASGGYTLTVTDGNGCTQTKAFNITGVNPITATFTNPTPCIGAPVTFTNTGSTGTYSWSISAPASVSGTTTDFSYTFLTTGAYNVVLRITNAGCTDSVTKNIAVANCSLVWPGDADNSGTADNMDLLAIGTGFGKTATTRFNASTNWTGQPSLGWADTLSNGTNYKHIDCNGDGIIAYDDTLSILLNYGLTHSLKLAEPKYVQGMPALYIKCLDDTVIAGNSTRLQIGLGTNSTQANNIYGLAFSIDFINPNLINIPTAKFSPLTSWLGTKGSNLISICHPNILSNNTNLAVCKTDKINSSGYGIIGELTCTTSSSYPGNIFQTVKFFPNFIKAINKDGSIIPINIVIDSLVVKKIFTEITLVHNSNSVTISPNPFTEETSIQFHGINAASHLMVYDLTGREVKNIVIDRGQNQYIFHRGDLGNGIYILKGLTIHESTIFINKLIVTGN